MDLRELIARLHNIKMFTQKESVAWNKLEELINHFKSQLPQ